MCDALKLLFVFSCFVSSSAVALGATADAHPPASPAAVVTPLLVPVKVLAVDLIPQDTDTWCWAAVGQMIFKFFKIGVKQCDEANPSSSLPSLCCVPVNAVPKACLHAGEPDFCRYGLMFSQMNGQTGLSMTMLENEILNERPIAYSRQMRGGGSPHIMVIYGFDTTGGLQLFVRDPLQEFAAILPQEYRGGLPYGWEHRRTYYNIVKGSCQ